MQAKLIKATSLAALNAVLGRLSLGQFMSEFETTYSTPQSHAIIFAETSFVGRTNSGASVRGHCDVFRKKQRNVGEFPIEKVLVQVTDLAYATLGCFEFIAADAQMSVREIDIDALFAARCA